MGMIPTFRHYGGKARMRNWLCNQFPISGHIFFDVFTGKGNVFFKIFSQKRFDQYIINDLNPFLKTLCEVDLNTINLPDKKDINLDLFKYLKNQNSPLSILLEPRITFSGKGYKYGFDSSCIGKRPFNKDLYYKNLEDAQTILRSKNVQIWSKDYRQINYHFGSSDFLYFDPPYLNRLCKGLPYSDIDHEHLVKIINDLECMWAISNYENSIYDNLKYKEKVFKVRSNEIKQTNTKSKYQVTEVLWKNY